MAHVRLNIGGCSWFGKAFPNIAGEHVENVRLTELRVADDKVVTSRRNGKDEWVPVSNMRVGRPAATPEMPSKYYESLGIVGLYLIADQPIVCWVRTQKIGSDCLLEDVVTGDRAPKIPLILPPLPEPLPEPAPTPEPQVLVV